MAYGDILFQLGMDLTGSSTTQEKQRKDFFISDDEGVYAGKHILIDLYDGEKLSDIKYMESVLKECINVSGATLIHIHLHHFSINGGISGVAVLSESHISVHTWPESNYAAFDIFMCGNATPEKAIPVLKEAFGSNNVKISNVKRGRQ